MSSDERSGILDATAATVLVDYLKERPDLCAVVTGRIGAQPNVRYGGDAWQVATWAGAGELMTEHYADEDIHGLLESGPHVSIEPVDETRAFQRAFEQGDLEREGEDGE